MKKTHNATASRIITSAQTEPHEKLASAVSRHLTHPFRKPFAPHNIDAFRRAESWLAQQPSPAPLIFDSFCGVGESTNTLANRYPESLVLGIDKSAHRLGKHLLNRQHFAGGRDNYLLVRADVDDFWRLAAEAGWRLTKHFLLYPNPWPKPGQLKYRVQGSAVFPTLLQLGGDIELRSNWPVYVREFGLALTLAGQTNEVVPFQPDPPITPFERKYSAAGQTLWRCRCSIQAKTP